MINDFFTAALPWVIMGLCLAIMFANMAKHKKAAKNEDKEAAPDNCMSEGMCVGMCVGMALGSATGMGTGMGLSLGMLIGLAVGSAMKKEQ